MMEVRARAPGKIILTGEHAVVHGSTAVAASIDLYTYASLHIPNPSDNDDTLKLQLKDVNLEFSWPVGKLKEALPKGNGCNASSPTPCSPEIVRIIAALVEEHNIPEAKIGLAAGVTAFLWLYTSIQGYKPAKVIVTSELPLGSGLGSSAAFCVSLSAAFIALSEYINLDRNQQGWLMFGGSELELVNKWAFEGERLIHGKPSGIDCNASSPTPCSPEIVRIIAALVEEHNIPEAKIGLAAGVTAFLWLYTSIQGYKPAKVIVTSELPLGSGLGSSAAFCVSLSAAFIALSEYINLDRNQQGWLMFGGSELELVNKWAFEGERLIHGKPSGIDNTVSTFGNMIKFKSGALTRIKSSTLLKMLITNTKVGRNTKALVAGVSERKLRHPDAMTAVFTAMDSISNKLATIIESPAVDDIAITEKEVLLQELMEMNQGLLQCMGVSHASIEAVIRTTLKYKLATKLTGAGGGGCVLTLLPTILSQKIVDKVIGELELYGFQCLTAQIGGNGLEICFHGSS